MRHDRSGERAARFTDIIPERAETLDRAQIVGDRLILSYLKDAASTAEVVSLTGQPVQAISLNAIGTASGFSGRPGDPETFYAFASFNQPNAVFRFDTRTGKSMPFALPKLSFNPADYAIEQRFYTSKDGTQVPMFLVRKKALTGQPLPTLLYGYGGFDISQTPSFSASRMAWLEAGGAFALANLRGGGEYGKAWHDAGRLANKQNVFDDFIAAGEYLIAQGITPKGGLVIEGRSNGGLLVGAVANQRPDLFAAGHAAVGVMDMLRFDRFTAGRYWVDDYGYPSKEADFKVLRSYSPYHNIRPGRLIRRCWSPLPILMTASCPGTASSTPLRCKPPRPVRARNHPDRNSRRARRRQADRQGGGRKRRRAGLPRTVERAQAFGVTVHTIGHKPEQSLTGQFRIAPPAIR